MPIVPPIPRNKRRQMRKLVQKTPDNPPLKKHSNIKLTL
ncbi:hypothetical protein XETH111194_01435 [Xenorhabdus thuongxuanensis]